MVTIVGAGCFTACLGILASETLTVFKAQERVLKAQESGEFNRSTPELVVDEVSVDRLVVCVALHPSLTNSSTPTVLLGIRGWKPASHFSEHNINVLLRGDVA